MFPGAPHNVAGTLVASPQARRARLWTGGASGPADVAQRQSYCLPSRVRGFDSPHPLWPGPGTGGKNESQRLPRIGSAGIGLPGLPRGAPYPLALPGRDHASLAQRREQLALNQRCPGSSPGRGTSADGKATHTGRQIAGPGASRGVDKIPPSLPCSSINGRAPASGAGGSGFETWQGSGPYGVRARRATGRPRQPAEHGEASPARRRG